MIVNHRDTLYFESKDQMNTPQYNYLHSDVKESYSLGFFIASRNLFGLPERAAPFKLENTKQEPLRMQALDVFPHEAGTNPMYSSIPYLTAHDYLKGDQSIVWMTASETWVDIKDDLYGEKEGSYVNFVTESGLMEFFIFSTDSPSTQSHYLSKITGF